MDRAKRRYNNYKKQLKQKKIAKNDNSLGFYNKRKAMDCGRSKCCLCGNPRKHKKFSKKDTLTIQELKANEFQKSQHLD